MSSDNPSDDFDDIDVIIPDSEQDAVEAAARELLALPAVKDASLPGLTVVFTMRK